jgi:hypothetical protein
MSDYRSYFLRGCTKQIRVFDGLAFLGDRPVRSISSISQENWNQVDRLMKIC